MKTINNVRILPIIISLMALPMLLQAQTEKNTEKKKTEKSVSDTLTYTVYGMDCPGCEGGLEKQVEKIPSVEKANADWREQKLVLVLRKDSVLNEKELEKRVKKANFTLKKEEGGNKNE